jgi:hypothetical protein
MSVQSGTVACALFALGCIGAGKEKAESLGTNGLTPKQAGAEGLSGAHPPSKRLCAFDAWAT